MSFMNLFLMLLGAVLAGYMIRPINNLMTYLQLRKQLTKGTNPKKQVLPLCQGEHSYLQSPEYMEGKICTKCGYSSHLNRQMDALALPVFISTVKYLEKKGQFKKDQYQELATKYQIDSSIVSDIHATVDKALIEFDVKEIGK